MRNCAGNYQYLLIGGAPRSGTSLLTFLLDWHPQVLSFPKEIPVLKNYWQQLPADRGRYFQEQFLSRAEGKQALFSDPEALKTENRRLQATFDGAPSLEIDVQTFQRGYHESILQDGPLLDRIFAGLAKGLLESNSALRNEYKQVALVAFKQPYYTELYAQDIASTLPTARFLHIVRSPTARYASSKMRHLKRQSFQGVDISFVTRLCETWISSQRMAEINRKALGVDRYQILSYEELLENPIQVMHVISKWLGIDFRRSLAEPSQFGQPMIANSSFDTSGGEVRKSYADRRSEFRKLTSTSERALIHYLLGLAPDLIGSYSVPRITRAQLGLTQFLPFRYETKTSYYRRVLYGKLGPISMPKAELRAALTDRLPTAIRSGRSAEPK